MENGEEKFHRLNDDEEIRRELELRNKHLSDRNTRLAGGYKEGYKEGYREGVRIVIRKIMKNRPDLSMEEIAELLEVDIQEVAALKNEHKRF